MSVEAGPCIPLEEHKRLLAEAIRCVATATLEKAASIADADGGWRARQIAIRIRALKEKA